MPMAQERRSLVPKRRKAQPDLGDAEANKPGGGGHGGGGPR